MTEQNTYDECRRLVQGFFHDEAKTKLWFGTPNPGLGGIVSPMDMIKMGKTDKLLRFIKNLLEDNRP